MIKIQFKDGETEWVYKDATIVQESSLEDVIEVLRAFVIALGYSDKLVSEYFGG